MYPGIFMGIKRYAVIVFRLYGSILQLVTKLYSICDMNNAHHHTSSLMSLGADQGLNAAESCAREFSLHLLLGLSGDRRAH